MEKRQKVLVALVGATLVLALYMQFGAGGPDPKVAAKPAAAQGAIPSMDQAKLSEADAYRLELLGHNATANPFYQGRGVLTSDEGAGQGEGPVYSGFIQAGKRAFAVLDGIEYGPGDELAEGGWRVKSIEKALVVLERTDGSTGRKVSKSVSLVESEADKIRIRVVKKR